MSILSLRVARTGPAKAVEAVVVEEEGEGMSTRSRVVARTGLATPTEPATAAEVEEVEAGSRTPSQRSATVRPSTFHHHHTAHRLHPSAALRLRHMQARCGL